VRIYEDLRLVQRRITVLQYTIVASIVGLICVFWYIQGLRARHYRELADENQSRLARITAPRGAVMDRHQHILIENRPSFSVTMRPEDCGDLDRTITTLGRLLSVGEAQIRERIAARGAAFRTVVIKANATARDVASIAARRLELPEVHVDPVPMREYPLHQAAAHVLGRIGEITERQLKTPAYEGASAGDTVGHSGIEASYNRYLMGRDGHRRLIVNSRGLEVREAERVDAVDGPTLASTLDADLQLALEQAFAGRAGSGVVIEPYTGAILALVSKPAYDPNVFAAGIEPAVWRRLTSDPETPLMNRAIQGQYSPGSLFKVVMAAAALEEGVVTPQTTVSCPGYLFIYGTLFHCGRSSGHGLVRLHQALAQSCNVYFYRAGVKLEIDRIARWAQRFGLGQPTGIDLPYEARGIVPSPAWKRRVLHAPWYPGETVSVAIGQGQVLVTPIQMARVAAAIANGGYLVAPYLVRQIGDSTLLHDSPRPIGLHPETVEAIRDGMAAVVNEHGTGWRARLDDVVVCGKTGSAQVVSSARLQRSGGKEEEIQPHAWFMGFAPKDNPKIAFAILVEHGRAGGVAAAPVARAMLERYFGSSKVTASVPSRESPQHGGTRLPTRNGPTVSQPSSQLAGSPATR
jgi:penicillin-binding protein 2